MKSGRNIKKIQSFVLLVKLINIQTMNLGRIPPKYQSIRVDFDIAINIHLE